MAFSLFLQNVQLPNASISLFVPDAVAVKEAHQKGFIQSPYWSQVWPAAKALAQIILDNPAYTKTKKVVELGAGLGLPSLAAARNASSVLCTDNEPEAVDVAKKSADYLGLKNFTTQVMDWEHLPTHFEADVLLLSDVSYDPAAFSPLAKIIEFFLQKRTTVLLSTPQRLSARSFILALLQHCIRQDEILVMHEGKEVPVTVLALQKE